jgi:hypothetical protein
VLVLRSPRHRPPQPRKPRIVAIRSNPLAAPLDSKRRKPSVSDARAARVGVKAEPLKDLPMPFAGLNNLAVRLAEKIVAEAERLLDGARLPKDAPIGCDPYDGAQRRRRDAEAGIACDQSLKPRTAHGMLGHIPTEGVNEDVDVRQDQSKRFIRSM